MKKILLLTAAACIMGSFAANAQISLTLGEPGYVERAPDYPSYHYDHHRHRHNDYWAHRPYERHDEHRR